MGSLLFERRGLRHVVVTILCTASLLGVGEAAHSQETQMPDSSVVHRNVFAARDNPIGLQNEYRIAWRKRLSDSQHLLLKDTFWQVGLHSTLTPAMERVGPRIDVKPLAVLQLYAMVEWIYFIGNFQFLQSYPDASVDYSDTAQRAGADRGENYSTSGWAATAGALLQAKVGDIAVRSNNRIAYGEMDIRAGHQVWYDIYYDMLLPRRSWVMRQENDLLWLKDRLIVGVRHTWTRSWLPQAVLAKVAAGADARDTTHRLGPFVAWRLTEEERYAATWFRRPTLVVLSQWWLAHPWRTGQASSQARPMFVLALSFDGRLVGE